MYFFNLFQVFNFFNPWRAATPSIDVINLDPASQPRYNFRAPRRQSGRPLYLRILPGLGSGAGTKRARPSDFVNATWRAQLERGGKRLKSDDYRTALLDVLVQDNIPDNISELSYDDLHAAVDGAIIDLEEQYLEYEASEIGWNDQTDVVPSDDGISEAEDLMEDESYSKFDAKEPTPEPFRDMPMTFPKNATFYEKETITRLHRAKDFTLDWPVEDTILHVHLRLRGLEPLFPWSWRADFHLPERLFTNAKPLIYTLGKDIYNIALSQEVRAIRAFDELVYLGTKARDYIKFGSKRPGAKNLKDTETIIAREINRYISWSLRDAGIDDGQKPYLDNILVMEARESTDIHLVKAEAARRMLAMRNSWRLALGAGQTTPIIYGIVCIGPQVVLCVLNEDVFDSEGGTELVGEDKAELREMGLASFRTTEDVLHAAAVALVAMAARKNVLEVCSGKRVSAVDVKGNIIPGMKHVQVVSPGGSLTRFARDAWA